MTDRSLTVFWDDAFLNHEAPDGEFELAWTGRLATKEPHPDRPERVLNIKSIVDHEIDEHVEWAAVSPATRDQLERVHDPSYVDEIRTFSEGGGGRLTAETGGNEATHRSATFAAGGAIAAVEHALGDADSVPYALVRPSGHHAQTAQADGFCFYNNVAVAAEHAIDTGGAERVAIVDWDVHHGNGTQEIFAERDDVLVVGIHNRHDSWDPVAHPQSGDEDENGTGDGEGYNLNVPLPPGTGDRGYAYALDRIVDPVLGSFEPDLLLVSAGQDPGTMDPLGRNVVTKCGFENLGRAARDLADRHADGRLALIQEGGYHVSHLAYATLGVLEGVAGIETGIEDPFAWLDEDYPSAERAIDEIAATHAEHWPVLVDPRVDPSA